MKKFLFLILMTAGYPALAHFQIGTYTGVSFADRTPCSFEITSVEFKNDMHHPLNERVNVVLHFMDGKEVQMAHLPLVDAVRGTVRPKGEVLTAVLPFPGGATAVELIMNENGPVQMLEFMDNYKDKSQNARFVCEKLQFQTSKK